MNKLNWRKTACTLLVMCAATAIALPAQTFTTLHSFDNTDGAYPRASLVQATNGNLYGTTTEKGGGTNCVPYGCGTAFTITPGGALTTVLRFDGSDGQYPGAALVQATDGSLYGTTDNGGASESCSFGCGTVFKIALSGTLTTLYSFCAKAGCADGELPNAALVQAVDGNLYGTTTSGGTSTACGTYGCGTVFRINPGGALTTLYSFCAQTGCADGTSPSGLVQAADGNFYGTTVSGGAKGVGTVFKITPEGTLTVLYSFCAQTSCADGQNPTGLVQGPDGSFYAATTNSGADGYGTVFRITPEGALTTLHSFDLIDGAFPEGGLLPATDGNFYGTTYGGGANSACGNPVGCGTVFEITPSGTLTTLYSFCPQTGCTDGDEPGVGLVQATNGTLYGTTASGGVNNVGTVFSLDVGLDPFVETQPTLGPVGSPVKILGTNLTGATSVTFNGTPAVFTVLSSSLIGVKVPEGATTGTVQVVTPSGTLSSNVPFRVRH